MLRVHHDNAVHRPRDPVDAERLRCPVWARDRIDDAAVRDLVKMHAGIRVLHRQLESAVALLGDRAADRIRQYAEPLRVKLRRGGRKKDRFHIALHLGVISTAVTPPLQVIRVSPAGKVGNSPPAMRIVPFLFSSPL